MERKKMELEVNKPTKIKLLYDDCVEGSSKYGKYFLYAVQNGKGSSEFSLFAAEQLHEELKKYKKNDELLVTKLATQRNSKLFVSYEVIKTNPSSVKDEPTQTPTNELTDDFLYTAMEKSLEQSIALAKKFNSVPIDKLAISLFIARTKGNLSFSN